MADTRQSCFEGVWVEEMCRGGCRVEYGTAEERFEAKLKQNERLVKCYDDANLAGDACVGQKIHCSADGRALLGCEKGRVVSTPCASRCVTTSGQASCG